VSERSRVSSKKPSERTSPVTFYRQVIAELRKVVWPTQQQLVTYFIVVMVYVLVMIDYVSVLDLAFGKAVFKIFGKRTRAVTARAPPAPGQRVFFLSHEMTE
jgi:preprotein translocase subunit SecE